MATFIGKMGVARGDVCNCTRKLYIRKGPSLYARTFSQELEFAKFFCFGLFPLNGNL